MASTVGGLAPSISEGLVESRATVWLGTVLDVEVEGLGLALHEALLFIVWERRRATHLGDSAKALGGIAGNFSREMGYRC